MLYRGWKITAYGTFLGFFAQFTSPIGQPHRTSNGFPTDEHAISYARAWIDYLLDCQRWSLETVPAIPAHGA